ncbi:MAG: TasA family protein [Firmicutes bacterium]|nr:TasA family protein [Bacillota bacterium]MDY5856159.1 TasA family protein [Anaerovoracaceae bacterium]
MRKKVLSLCLVVALIATAVIGGTLAYFTDTDAKSNVFTTGNVDIKLIENFGDNDPATPEKLLPATGSAQAGTLKNGITKEVTVQNVGTEDAYVRVHIAIPSILDNGNPAFDAGKNTLHFNYTADSIGEGKWDWSKTAGAPYEGDWNYYETTIDNIKYNVYVVTYGTALKTNDVTPEKAMHQVYLDSRTSQAAIDSYIKALGNNWQIKVLAEGTQAAGFADAYTALNTAFGVPGTYTVDWSGAVNQ